MPLSTEEKAFLKRAMRYFDVVAVEVEDSTVHDIAVQMGAMGPPKILLGRVFHTSAPTLRRSKITHELLHCVGLKHDPHVRALGYFSRPERDKLSPRVYRDIVAGSRRFQPAKFGL